MDDGKRSRDAIDKMTAWCVDMMIDTCQVNAKTQAPVASTIITGTFALVCAFLFDIEMLADMVRNPEFHRNLHHPSTSQQKPDVTCTGFHRNAVSVHHRVRFRAQVALWYAGRAQAAVQKIYIMDLGCVFSGHSDRFVDHPYVASRCTGMTSYDTIWWRHDIPMSSCEMVHLQRDAAEPREDSEPTWMYEWRVMTSSDISGNSTPRDVDHIFGAL